MARYLYSELAGLIQARKNCDVKRLSGGALQTEISTNANAWFERHTDHIETLVDNLMPSGGGFDNGTKIDLDASHVDKLVFTTSYHHMNDGGFYDGWTEHTVTVTPSLHSRYHLRISGRNRNDIKEYIHQAFSSALDADVEFEVFQLAYVMEISPVWAISGSKIERWVGKVCTKESGHGTVTTNGGTVTCDAYQTVAECSTSDEAKRLVLEYVKANRANVTRAV